MANHTPDCRLKIDDTIQHELRKDTPKVQGAIPTELLSLTRACVILDRFPKESMP